MSSPLLPIALRAGTAHALIVGAGDAALRKARSLLAGGFRLVVVAPSIAEPLRALALREPIRLVERPYETADLDGCALVVSATGDASVNARVVAQARERRILVCNASDGESGDFTMMAAQRIGDLTLALDSGGSSPSFSRRVLDDVAATIGDDYARAARALARIRADVRERLPRDERIALLRDLSAAPLSELAHPPSRVACASRASALAMAQTRGVAALLAQRGVATEILDVTTAGDRDRERPLHALGETNVFVTELEAALREGRARYAVHSAKDLPSELAADMRVAAVSAREDARDAFCSERFSSFETLPPGARVGTSSLRRRAALEALRPDLRYEDVRGNVDTRLRKLRNGEYDAIVLAMAGLRRLGTQATHTVAFSVEELVPAAGQGALAVETLAGDSVLAYELWAAVNDRETELCVRCERAALRALRAGCSAPVGAHAIFGDGRLRVVLSYAASGGMARDEREARVASIEQAEALGDAIGRDVAGRYRPLAQVRQ